MPAMQATPAIQLPSSECDKLRKAIETSDLDTLGTLLNTNPTIKHIGPGHDDGKVAARYTLVGYAIQTCNPIDHGLPIFTNMIDILADHQGGGGISRHHDGSVSLDWLDFAQCIDGMVPVVEHPFDEVYIRVSRIRQRLAPWYKGPSGVAPIHRDDGDMMKSIIANELIGQQRRMDYQLANTLMISLVTYSGIDFSMPVVASPELKSAYPDQPQFKSWLMFAGTDRMFIDFAYQIKHAYGTRQLCESTITRYIMLRVGHGFTRAANYVAQSLHQRGIALDVDRLVQKIHASICERDDLELGSESTESIDGYADLLELQLVLLKMGRPVIDVEIRSSFDMHHDEESNPQQSQAE